MQLRTCGLRLHVPCLLLAVTRHSVRTLLPLDSVKSPLNCIERGAGFPWLGPRFRTRRYVPLPSVEFVLRVHATIVPSADVSTRAAVHNSPVRRLGHIPGTPCVLIEYSQTGESPCPKIVAPMNGRDRKTFRKLHEQVYVKFSTYVRFDGNNCSNMSANQFCEPIEPVPHHPSCSGLCHVVEFEV